jgi:hypothetical protein
MSKHHAMTPRSLYLRQNTHWMGGWAGSCGGTEESNLHRVDGSPLLYLVISFTENLSERNCLENRGGGKVILQWILERPVVKKQIGFIRLSIVSIGRLHSGFITRHQRPSFKCITICSHKHLTTQVTCFSCAIVFQLQQTHLTTVPRLQHYGICS